MTEGAPTPLTSASQVSKWDECERKWGLQYLAKLETPQSPAALLGTEIDDTQLQPYFTMGRAFDYTRESGYIAASILPYLPPPKTPGLQVQKYFTLPSASAQAGQPTPFGYQGYIDLWVPDSSLLKSAGGAPGVCDFKSTSDLKWAKTPEILATDTQAMLYATAAMYETGARVVDLVWLYMQTRGARKSRRVHLRVSADQALEQFMRIDRTACQMKAVRDAAPTEPSEAEAWVLRELKPTPSACEKFGGCPFRHKCNLGPGDIIAAMAGGIEMSGTNSLLARLQTQAAAVNGSAAPAPTETKPEPVAALGINPPEKDLPPAPPVGVVETKTNEDKPKRGRPAKATVTAEAPAAAPVDINALAKAVVDELIARLTRAA